MDSAGERKEVSSSHLEGSDIARQNIGVVVTSISKEMSLSGAEWTLDNLLTAGDLLILLGVHEDTIHHPLAQSCDWHETDGKVVPDEVSRLKSEIEKTTAVFQSSCREKGVFFEIRVKAGAVKSVVVEEVNAVDASSVTLDRNLKLKKWGDMKLIQDNISCEIYLTSNGNEADLMHEAVSTEEESDEEAEATSMSLDLESDYFSSSQAVSSVPGSIDYQQFSAHADAFYTPVDSPIDIPTRTAGNARSSVGRGSSSLPVRSSVLSTSVSSSSSTPTVIRKPMPRSASDSSFKTYAAGSSVENVVPIHAQPKRPDLLKRPQGKYVNNESHWLADYTILETDVFQNSRGRPSLLVEKQEQNDPHNQELTKAPLQQQKISSTQKPIDRNFPSKSFSQGGRSLLCSVCKQMSPVLRNIPRRFSYVELQAATDNFSKDNFLAEGGFGFVYKGVLKEQDIAVKQHKLASTQGYKEFRAEVELLSCAQHRNLVMLLGCCDENGHRMLVYEYVCNRSLDWHLSPKSPECLGWAARQKIAIGAARALRYLHEECRVGCIIHRDMRPNNILLTHDFEPMVGDFGLARSHPEGEGAIETRIIGTFGYLAPEYAESGRVSWKADVYAFGVVLLELITGRKAIDLIRPPGQQSLTEWARPKLLDDAMFADLVDTRLGKFYIVNEMRAMMRAAHYCIKRDPVARPRMSQVLHFLEGENKDSDEISRRALNVYAAAIPKVSDSQTSTIQPATALPSLKSQTQKQQAGNSSRKKKILLYEDML